MPLKAKLILIAVIYANALLAQISPGELVKVHAHLEGMGKCTQCHVLGDKVSNAKCLACHTEIKERIDLHKGYHASAEVKGKECATCHNDHHGKNFQIVHFETSKFQHNLTGFKLEGAHSKVKCEACHVATAISNAKIKAKSFTYMGLGAECLSCHVDYHQKTLAANCTNCHTMDGFKPAVKFNHANTKFALIGKHQQVDCAKCHKIETKAGVKFQNFTGLQFNNCTNCHADVHDNKFGQNCTQCHSEESFHNIKGGFNFDHSKTGYLLEGKHATVNCKLCHKGNNTDPLKHDKCTDCHTDYHKGQFLKTQKSTECSVCHTVNGFSPSNFTIEKHNACAFKLNDAHIAVPCLDCHKKQAKWSFKEIGKTCADCHKNIHEGKISAKFYPDNNCKACHFETEWAKINFDHSLTSFELTGKHANLNCRKCHFNNQNSGHEKQAFKGLASNCISCHPDNHQKQFEQNGTTNCNNCHSTNSWHTIKFDHNQTAFKLDGKHQNVECNKCHIPGLKGEKTIYKIKNFTCEACHLPQ